MTGANGCPPGERCQAKGWQAFPLAVGTILRRFLSLLIVPAFLSSGLAAESIDASSLNQDFTALSLEELSSIKIPIVFGASKREQRADQAPGAVSVVTQDDIKQYGYQTLGDILRSVPGFYTTDDRSYTSIGLRGANWAGSFGGRTLILVDGHRMSDPIYDSAAIGQDFPLDVDLVDRVEVVRGPGLSLYGNNAFFTVINVITRRGQDLGRPELSAAAASYDAYSGRLSYGNRWKSGLEVMISGTLFDRRGHDELYYPEYSSINGGKADQIDAENAQKAYTSISYGDFTLSGLWGRREKQAPTAIYVTMFNDPRLWMRDDRGYVQLNYQHEFGDGWHVTGRLYYDDYRFFGVYPYSLVDPPDPAQTYKNYDDIKAQWWGGEVNVSKILHRHTLILGTEFNLALDMSQWNYDVSGSDPPATVANVESQTDNVGVYLQDEFSIRTNLLLNVAARYDYYQTFGNKFNLRGGLIYSPCESTTLKGIVSQGYRAPNAYERDYEAVGYLPNPNLKPKQILAYELTWEQTLSRHLRLSVSGFYNQLDCLITQVQEGDDLVFRNTESADMRGVELELHGRWAHGLRSSVSYTYAHVVDNATGRRIANSPEHLGKFHLAVPLWREKIFAGFEVLGTSGRKGFYGKPEVDGYVTANATLFSRELVKGLEFSASVYNLLGTEYSDPAGLDFLQDSLPQDGRTFRVKLTYKF